MTTHQHTPMVRLCATSEYVQAPLSYAAHRAEAAFWLREFRTQSRRLDGIGRATDLGSHWSRRDAEMAKDDAERLYLEHKAAAETAVSLEAAE